MSDQTLSIRRPPETVPAQQEQLKYPTEIIPLPTKGWFYASGHPLSKGDVEVKQMTAKEEDILANPELVRKGKVIDKLFESLIVDKSINIDEILVPDKNAILFAIRRLAYGDEYPISITCPNCNEQQKISINLGSLENKPFDFEKYNKGENSFHFVLPNSKKEITFKLLNQIDDNGIDAEIANLKRISKDATGELTTRLKYLITSINGDTNKSTIRKFVDEELKANDSLALRKHLRENQPDLDRTFDYHCNSCDFERRIDIPVGITFLWPDNEY